MVDALASGASGRKAVEVRVLSWAPNFQDSPNCKQLTILASYSVWGLLENRKISGYFAICVGELVSGHARPPPDVVV